jgi:hypothetical protein
MEAFSSPRKGGAVVAMGSNRNVFVSNVHINRTFVTWLRDYFGALNSQHDPQMRDERTVGDETTPHICLSQAYYRS